MILSEILFQNPSSIGVRKPLILWTRGNQIASFLIQVILAGLGPAWRTHCEQENENSLNS